jgi:hypothetical protein
MDLTDLETQLASGELTCPVCGDSSVRRRPSTFGLVKNRSSSSRPPTESAPPPAGRPPKPEGLEAAADGAFKKLLELSDKLEKDFVDVGTNFTAEALKIHYGAAPARNIRGHSTADEEKTLRSEGIEFFKLPMLSRKSPAS